MKIRIAWLLVPVLASVSCQKQQNLSGRRILAFQASHKATLNEEITKFNAKLAAMDVANERFGSLRDELAEKRLSKSELRQRRVQLERRIKELETERVTYGENVVIQARQDGVGEQLAELVVPGGRAYRDVTIQEVTDVGLEITHQTGTARVPFSRLPGEFQTRFFYDPAIAEAAMAEERRLAHQRDQRISTILKDRMMENAERLEKKAKLAMEEEARKARSSAVAAVSTTRYQPERSRSTWRERRSTRRYRRSYSSYYYYSTPRNSHCPPSTTIRPFRSYTRSSGVKSVPVVRPGVIRTP